MAKMEETLERIRKDLKGRANSTERDWRYGMTITLTGTALAVYVNGERFLAFALLVSAIAIFARPRLIKIEILTLRGYKWQISIGIAAVLVLIGLSLSILDAWDIALFSDFRLSTSLLSIAFVLFVYALVFKEPPPEQNGQTNTEKSGLSDSPSISEGNTPNPSDNPPMESVIEEKPKWIYRFASTMERRMVAYFAILLLEGYLLLFAIYGILILFHYPWPYLAFLLTAWLIMVQTLWLWGIRVTAGYMLHLARVVANAPIERTANFSYKALMLRATLLRISSLGNRLSGGNFRNLLLLRLHEQDSTISFSLTMSQIVAAIELDVARNAMKISNGQVHMPFAVVSGKIESHIRSKPIIVANLCDLIAECYMPTDKDSKECARVAFEGARFSDSGLEKMKTWAQLIGAIVAIFASVATITTYLMD